MDRLLLMLLVVSLQAGAAVGSSRALTALDLTRVTANVYSAIGETGPPTYDNGGHNNNLSLILTSLGVVVFNGGDSYMLANRLHLAIQQLTDLPVILVVNENGQGHSFLGNSYWCDQGVKLIAHRRAVEEMRHQGEQILKRMQPLNKEKAEGTYVAIPEHEFDEFYGIDMGGTMIELRSFGEAHSPGDISLWLPTERLLITGDIAFHQRLLAIFPDTNVAAWIESFDAMASLKPELIIPGHGEPTDLATIRSTTQGYLQFLRGKIEEIIERDGDLADAYAIDQSGYSHLDTFKELAGKNAGRLFQTMEMESF